MLRLLALLSIATAALGCRNQPDGQSFAEGMRIICQVDTLAGVARHPPEDRIDVRKRFLGAELKSARARALIPQASRAEPADKVALRAALSEAGLDDCALLDDELSELGLPPDRAPSAAGAVLSSDIPLTVLAVASDAIRLDGIRVVALDAWQPREGGSLSDLETRLRRQGRRVGAPPRLGLLVDREAPFSLLARIVELARPLGIHDVQLIVRDDSEEGLAAMPLVMRPLTPPDDAGETPARDAGPARLKLAVAVTPRALSLWSVDGQEGTPDDPAATLAPVTPAPTFALPRLSAALLAIVQKRWPGQSERPPESEEIAVLVAPAIPVQTVVDVMLAVRVHDTGTPLFPRPLVAQLPAPGDGE